MHRKIIERLHHVWKNISHGNQKGKEMKEERRMRENFPQMQRSRADSLESQTC